MRGAPIRLAVGVNATAPNDGSGSEGSPPEATPTSRFVALVACSGSCWAGPTAFGKAGEVGPVSGRRRRGGGDDVSGVAVEGDSGSVVAHGGARVGVAGFLHISQGDSRRRERR